MMDAGADEAASQLSGKWGWGATASGFVVYQTKLVGLLAISDLWK